MYGKASRVACRRRKNSFLNMLKKRLTPMFSVLCCFAFRLGFKTADLVSGGKVRKVM